MDVLTLAGLGWHLIAMQRGSKNPGSLVGEGWPAKCTNDPATIQAWSDLGLNFGVLLGSKSGIIDLEYDTDEGRDIIDEACKGVETLAYRSAKSIHRIFLWDERFAHERAKAGFRGTEWRFGQNAAQSVIPPSVHESGALYSWISTVQPIRLPDSLWLLYQQLRLEAEKKQATQEEPKDYGSDTIINLARTEIEKTSWSVLLESRGWKVVRNRGDATDWRRPGKKGGSLSATTNYGGSGRLAVFSTACAPLEADSSYDKFGFVCLLDHEDDPIKASRAILPPEVVEELDRQWREKDILPINWTLLNQQRDNDEIDDEEFCQKIVPATGLLRDVHTFYGQKAYRRSHVMGLACAVALCETIFGRRIRSHTDLRTNDYNLILATTGAGKEACEGTITALLERAGETAMLPPDVQSGNGLMKAVSTRPASIWVCDEFGKILQSMLDKKGNQHIRNIGNHLLKLYGKSAGSYGGAAHSDGVRNRVVQPSLTILGLSTSSTVFDVVSTEQVSDGLIGRIAFWPVQDRPEPRDDMGIAEPSPELIERIRNWIAWQPLSSGDYPNPATLSMSDDAKARWTRHAKEINEKMSSESELKAAIWSRVAARTMKLALVHRAARVDTPPASTNWDFILVELADVQWAIVLSNWLARIACGLIRENVYDKSGDKAKKILLKALESQQEIIKRDLLRAFRSLTAGDVQAAADELGLETFNLETGGRPKVAYRRKGNL